MNHEAKLQRRVLLKALGLGLSAPLAFKFSKLALAQSTRPKRMILFYFPHGVPNEHMDMEPYLMPSNEMFKDYGASADAPTAAMQTNADYTLNTRSGFNILSPLEAYRSQMTIVRGLNQSGTFDTHDSIGAILTGNGVSSSLDQMVAQELAMKSLFLGSVTRNNAQLDLKNGVLSRNEAGWRTPENDVVKAYDDIFGGLGSTDPRPPVDGNSFRDQALDLTMSEITQMRSAVSGLTQEENKLSAHLAALENIKAGSQGLGPGTGDSCLAAPPVANLDEFRAEKAAYTSNDGTEYWQDGSLAWKPNEEKKTNFTKMAESQAELAAYAVLCGQAQVVTVQNGWASADYPLPQLLPHHPDYSYHSQVSHVSYTGDLASEARLDYASVQQWFIGRMARMCEILDQPDPFDPEHTALENTIIYGFSEIGDGDMHTKSLSRMWNGATEQQIFAYYPAIILGGGGGSLGPGKLITVDNRPIADLLLTLAQGMGSGASSFSTLSTGPIEGILV